MNNLKKKMEQTTLQQRIEERAKQKLLKDLYAAADLEQGIQNIVGQDNYEKRLAVMQYQRRYSSLEIEIKNDFTQSLFCKLLPRYISSVTDEILQKIDEIDYLVQSNKELQEDLP